MLIELRRVPILWVLSMLIFSFERILQHIHPRMVKCYMRSKYLFGIPSFNNITYLRTKILQRHQFGCSLYNTIYLFSGLLGYYFGWPPYKLLDTNGYLNRPNKDKLYRRKPSLRWETYQIISAQSSPQCQLRNEVFQPTLVSSYVAWCRSFPRSQYLEIWRELPCNSPLYYMEDCCTNGTQQEIPFEYLGNCECVYASLKATSCNSRNYFRRKEHRANWRTMWLPAIHNGCSRLVYIYIKKWTVTGLSNRKAVQDSLGDKFAALFFWMLLWWWVQNWDSGYFPRESDSVLLEGKIKGRDEW